MSKRTVFTTVTALPAGITRQSVLETLHDHMAMIDLNPLVERWHSIKPSADATPEEYHCRWYQMTDKVNYLPLGLYSGRVTYKTCFHNLADGLQTHVYAPLGLSIKERWTVGGSLPGEPIKAVELGLGLPMSGLWLREDVTLKCSIFATKFVRKNLTKAHARLVDRLLVKSQLADSGGYDAQMWTQRFYLPLNLPTSPEIQLPIFSRELIDIDPGLQPREDWRQRHNMASQVRRYQAGGSARQPLPSAVTISTGSSPSLSRMPATPRP
ncbi:hypothetical protein BKA61DRAFT_714703 [Leptodontidium sp. MPI-SDFR-AT-0119]|nr:hypothetical protein BKA61DRAFT_714703 [Leptodontidium sp. MPI-SDFR-AT-0119]